MTSNEGGPANDLPGASDPSRDRRDGGDGGIARDRPATDDQPSPDDDGKPADGLEAIDLDSVRDRAS